jgi:hypothetical protein
MDRIPAPPVEKAREAMDVLLRHAPYLLEEQSAETHLEVGLALDTLGQTLDELPTLVRKAQVYDALVDLAGLEPVH